MKPIRIIPFLCFLLAAQFMLAQPPMRRTQEEQKKQSAAPTLSVRAQTQYTGQVTMPENLIWKREIYRTLDLKEVKNAALYYPVEPVGNRMNLFTYVFKLLAENKIPAYEYRLDGTEVLTPENRINFRDLLDRFHIYYEEVVENRDTLLRVDNSDIPSAEVLSYFIKENWYFDQRSSTMNSQVTAICPVLHRAGDFSMEVVKSPMFWLNYADLVPYLSQMPIMISDLNNTSNLNINDYFLSRLYKGEIYKTTNMLNQTLSQYCPTDSALVKEQQRIESQLKDFDDNLWESTRNAKKAAMQAKADSTLTETTAKVEADEKGEAVTAKATMKRNSKKMGRDKAVSASKGSSAKKEKVNKSNTKSKSSGTRVSVRRERR